MASPQLENGFTRIATEILEHLIQPGINGSEYRILLFVIRKTYGFNKKMDRISLSQFEESTQMQRANVVSTIKDLVAKHILVKEKNSYKLNKNWEEWVVAKRLPSSQKHTTASSQKHTKSSSQKHTHNRQINNITIDTAPSAGVLGNEVINLFSELNPSYKRLFERKPQHQAAERLIEIHGFEKIKKAIEFVTLRRTDQYCPTITTPTQLEDKWGALEKYAIGLKSLSTKGRGLA